MILRQKSKKGKKATRNYSENGNHRRLNYIFSEVSGENGVYNAGVLGPGMQVICRPSQWS